jgi:Carbohydrate family 9 binding domain-like
MLKSILMILMASGTTLLATPKNLTAAPVAGKIKLDGKLDESAWKNAKSISGFEGVMGTKKVSVQTSVKALYGPNALYLGVEMTEPKTSELAPKGGVIWADDRIEFPLSVNSDDPAYFLFAVNCAGKKEEGYFGGDYSDEIAEFNKPWQAAVYKSKKSWFVEIRIPYKTLGGKPVKGKFWKINFCRQRSPGKSKTEYSAWIKKFGGFHYTGGKLQFK